MEKDMQIKKLILGDTVEGLLPRTIPWPTDPYFAPALLNMQSPK